LATTDEQKAIYRVLNVLRAEGAECIRRGHPNAARALKNAQGKYSPIDAGELETLLMHGPSKGAFDKSKVLFLQPPAKEGAAATALWCRWDYECDPPRCGFYVGLWSRQPPFPKPPDGASAGHHIAFIGYRFETPEMGTNHNYYHAQPCRSMGQKDDEIETALPISYRMPTWPIAATCALELLLCFVASMYGFRGLRQLQDALNNDVAARGSRLLQSALKATFASGWPKPAA
jgi:hypothetical protein